MVECKTPSEQELPGVVPLKMEGPDLNIDKAKEAAKRFAHTYVSDPELVGWYDGNSNKFEREGETCGDGKPDWIEYARSKGGNLTVNVNGEQFVFIFRGVQTFP